MSKPGKVLRNICKKLGVRLTVKRGKKRVYKSVAVLKRQCANKKKKKVKSKKKVKKRKRRRKFGMVAGAGFITAIDQQKKLEERKVQEELSSNLNKYLGGGQHDEGIAKEIYEHYNSIYEIEQRKRNIKEVIEAAKDWKRHYPYKFIGADLKGMDMSGYDPTKDEYLSFSKINLEGVNLEGANLEGLILEKVNLRNANLQGTNLRKTDLRGTDLKGADLSEAYLGWANLTNADLRGADFRVAEGWCIFVGAKINSKPVTINGIEYKKTMLSAGPSPRPNLSDERVPGNRR